MLRQAQAALRRNRPTLRSKAERGIALISVLCLLGLLGVLALGALEAARRHGHMAQRSFEITQATELADSAIRLRILELSFPPRDQPQPAAVSRSLELFEQRVTVEVEVEAGRIDLNAADEPLLTAAFAGNGFPESEASVLARRVMDWRDVDDSTRDRGAERQDYRRAGRTSGPRNGPFETATELRHVLGAHNVSDELLNALTVYSHSSTVRQNVASGAAMNALRWADAQQLAGRSWLEPVAVATGVSSQPNNLAGEVIRLRACAAGRSANVKICRVAIVRLTGNNVRPALVYAWRTQYTRG